MSNNNDNEGMEIEITLTNRETAMLISLANSAGIPPLEYGRNIIKDWIRGQIRGFYIRKLDGKTDDELASMFGEVS